MKKILCTLFLLLSVVAVNAQKKASKFDLKGFDVTLIISNTFSYSYDKSLPVVEKLSGGKLTLLLQNDESERQTRAKVIIRTPSVEDIELHNSSIKCQGQIIGKRLRVNFSGASTAGLSVKVDELNANLSSASALSVDGWMKEVKASVRSASSIKLGGAVGTLDGLVTSASYILSSDLKIENMYLDLSSASVGRMSLDARVVDLKASSASKMNMDGTADIMLCSARSTAGVDVTGLKVRDMDIKQDKMATVRVKSAGREVAAPKGKMTRKKR